MAYEEQFLIFIDPDYLAHDKRKDPIWTSEAYIAAVRNIVINIGKSQVGNILLRSIRWHGKLIRVAPPDPWSVSNCANTGNVRFENKDLYYNKIAPSFFGPIGAVIKFHPVMWAQGSSCYNKHKSDDYVPTPESVLLHELVHVFRRVSNKFETVRDTQAGGLTLYSGIEEFYSVLVENIYQSELKGHKGHIRASHQGFFDIDNELKGSFEFFKVSTKAFEVVAIFCDQNRGLTRALAQVKIPFNPIAAYYQNPTKARENSNSHFAAVRDQRISGLVGVPSDFSWERFKVLLQ